MWKHNQGPISDYKLYDMDKNVLVYFDALSTYDNTSYVYGANEYIALFWLDDLSNDC